MSKVHELVFETPARNQGQIVTYSHAKTRTGQTITCRHDASDGSVHYSWANGNRLSAAALSRHGLTERG